jgi:hypothetical protein
MREKQVSLSLPGLWGLSQIRGIFRELKGRAETAFSEDGEGILEQAKGVRAYIGMKLEGAGESLSRRTLKTYRKTLKESVKKLNTCAKQRDIMGKRNSYSKTGQDAAFMRMKGVSKSGYESEVTVYACGNCDGCPVREGCTASKKNREMGVSKKLLAFREASRANITSEEGILLRVNRSIQTEEAFGVTKEDSRFRGFMTRLSLPMGIRALKKDLP